MFLKNLHLKNYRRYKDEYIEFPTGIIGIVGRNGTGKSTLIEAIGWCLYGNKASRTKKEQIKTTGISKSEDCSVALEIMLGGNDVKVIRELRGKDASGRASAFVNGNIEVRGMNEVSEFIIKRTGMDHVAFFTSVFARQKELNYLSNLQLNQRKKIIMRLLRINKIDNAIEAIRTDIKNSKETISILETTLKDIDALERQYDETSKEKRDTIKHSQDYKKKIEILSELIKDRKVEFQTQKSKYDKYNKIHNELAGVKAQKNGIINEKQTTNSDLKIANQSKEKMKQIKPKINKFKTIKIKKDKLDLIRGKFEAKTRLETQYSEKISKIKKQKLINKKINNDLIELKKFNQKLKIQKIKLEKYEDDKKNIDDLINAIAIQIKNNHKQIIKLTQESDTIKKTGKKGKCPTCKQPLEKHFDYVVKYFSYEISELSKKEKTDNQEKKKHEIKLESIEKKISNINKIVVEYENMYDKRISLQAKLETGRTNIVELNQEKTNLSKKLKQFSNLKYDNKLHSTIIKQYEELYNIYEEYGELSANIKRIPILLNRQKQYRITISKLTKKELTLTTQLKNINFTKSGYESSMKKLDEANKNHTNINEQLIKSKSQIVHLTSEVEQNLSNIKEEREKQIKINNENEKIKFISKLEQIMNEFKLDLISRIRPMLSQRSSQLFEKMTKGKYSSIELDEEYNIIIKDEGNDFNTDRFSGGEEDLANLCLRIAISQELAERAGGMQSNFIALDEIFGSQDEGRKHTVLKALNELSSKFKQILIITHVEDVKESLPYVLVIKENSDNTVKIETEGQLM